MQYSLNKIGYYLQSTAAKFLNVYPASDKIFTRLLSKNSLRLTLQSAYRPRKRFAHVQGPGLALALKLNSFYE